MIGGYTPSDKNFDALVIGYERRVMAIVDWSECPLVEVIPGKVSGAPLLKDTRLPVEAVTGVSAAKYLVNQTSPSELPSR